VSAKINIFFIQTIGRHIPNTILSKDTKVNNSLVPKFHLPLFPEIDFCKVLIVRSIKGTEL
jgi:hypothetical protein